MKGAPVYKSTAEKVAEALGVSLDYLTSPDEPGGQTAALHVQFAVRSLGTNVCGGMFHGTGGRVPEVTDGFRFFLLLFNRTPEPLVVDRIEFRSVRHPRPGPAGGPNCQEGIWAAQMEIAHVVCLRLSEDGWHGRWVLRERREVETRSVCAGTGDLFECQGTGPLVLPIEAHSREVVGGSVAAHAAGLYRVSFKLGWLVAGASGEWSSPEVVIVRTDSDPSRNGST